MTEKKKKNPQIIPLTIHETPDALTITVPPRRALGAILLVFASLWNGGLWCGLLGTYQNPFNWAALGDQAWILLIFILAGAALMLYAVSSVVNTTTLHFTAQALTITSAPLTLRRRRIARASISEVMVEAQDDPETFSLYIKTRSWVRHPILTDMPRHQADELAQAITDFLTELPKV